MTDEQEKPNFARSAESVRIEARLAKLAVNEEITYEEINALALGMNVQGADRSKLYSAMRQCMTRTPKDGEPGYSFGCITGKGIKRLDNAGIFDKTKAATKRIRKSTKRSVRELKQTHFESLSVEQRQAFTMQVSALTAIHFCTKESNIAQLAEPVKSSSGTLKIGDTLAAFSKI